MRIGRKATCLFLVTVVVGGCASAESPNAVPPSTVVAREVPDSDSPSREVTEEAGSLEPHFLLSDDDDWVVVSELRWKFRTPKNWHRVSVGELDRRNARLSPGVREFLETQSGSWRKDLKFAVMEALPSERAGAIPTLQGLLKQMPGEPPVRALCQVTFDQMSGQLADAKLIRNEARVVRGKPGGDCDLSYALAVGGEQIAVESRTVVVTWEGGLMQLSLSGPAPLDHAPLDAVMASIESLD